MLLRVRKGVNYFLFNCSRPAFSFELFNHLLYRKDILK